ncbi:M48 family metalloprotease [Emticicia sp. ODNR4P]|nr:M48 family metalloprotease [Emticicia sp. ODNR4P]
MQYFESPLSPQTIYALAWTLVHSLWQLSLFFFLYKFISSFFRQNASVRYWTGIGVLLVQFLVSGITFWKNYPSEAPVKAMTFSVQNSPIANNLSTSEPINQAPLALSSVWEQTAIWLNLHLDWLVMLWILGMSIMTIKLIGGYFYVQKLRWQCTNLVETDTENLFKQLLNQFDISRTVEIRESQLIESPLTIGYLQPLVLVPIGLLTGLSQGEIKAIFAHELAHIKRHDYLINIIQSMIEILFFYHPLVWVIGESIRQDREDCCDDWALEICQNKLYLAKALTFVETFRQQSKTSLTMAFSGNKPQLLGRIQRILGVQQKETTNPVGIISSVVVLALAFCCLNLTQVKAQASKLFNKSIKTLAQTSKEILSSESISTSNVEETKSIAPSGEEPEENKLSQLPTIQNDYSDPDSLKVAMHEQEIEKLQKKMDPYLKQIQALSAQMGVLGAKMQLEQKPFQQFSEQIGKLGGELGTLVGKQVQLEMTVANLDKKSDEYKKVQKELSAIEKQRVEIEKRMEKASKEMESMSNKMEVHSAPMDSLGKEMEKLSKPIEDIGKEIEVHAKAIEEIDPEGKYWTKNRHYGSGYRLPKPPKPPKAPKAPSASSAPKPPKPPKAPSAASAPSLPPPPTPPLAPVKSDKNQDNNW